MPEWRAEIDLDETRVRSVIGGHFPELDLATLAPLAEGWDNALWITGAGIAFRFTRRAIACAGVEREIALLPKLAPRLPLPIPVPHWVGEPSGAFPWPFFGARATCAWPTPRWTCRSTGASWTHQPGGASRSPTGWRRSLLKGCFGPGCSPCSSTRRCSRTRRTSETQRSDARRLRASSERSLSERGRASQRRQPVL
jgi:hypothetical protein